MCVFVLVWVRKKGVANESSNGDIHSDIDLSICVCIAINVFGYVQNAWPNYKSKTSGIQGYRILFEVFVCGGDNDYLPKKIGVTFSVFNNSYLCNYCRCLD